MNKTRNAGTKNARSFSGLRAFFRLKGIGIVLVENQIYRVEIAEKIHAENREQHHPRAHHKRQVDAPADCKRRRARRKKARNVRR